MFQKTMATGRFTLAVAYIFASLLWVAHSLLAFGNEGVAHMLVFQDDGGILPLPPIAGLLAGLAVSAVATYAMAELNNAFVMLRINSRVLSSTLLVLITSVASYHTLQSAHLIICCSVLAYFPLFRSYQRPEATVNPFLVALAISVSSLVFARMLWFVPILWVSQALLRSFSFRGWVASLFGLLMPYWLWAGTAYCMDRWNVFEAHVQTLLQLHLPDYAHVDWIQFLPVLLAFLLFLIGLVDNLLNQHLDKTRIRCHYSCVIFTGLAAYVWIALQPQDWNYIFPVAMTGTAMLGGHFLALSVGRVQNIVSIIFVLSFALVGIVEMFLYH